MSFSTSNFIAFATGVAMAPSVGANAAAQSAPLSAQESDPNVMGWIQGFSPPGDRMIKATVQPGWFCRTGLRKVKSSRGKIGKE
jgi:hypothetical protein